MNPPMSTHDPLTIAYLTLLAVSSIVAVVGIGLEADRRRRQRRREEADLDPQETTREQGTCHRTPRRNGPHRDDQGDECGPGRQHRTLPSLRRQQGRPRPAGDAMIPTGAGYERALRTALKINIYLDGWTKLWGPDRAQ